MEKLPILQHAFFCLIVVLTLLWSYWATRSKLVVAALCFWVILQSLLAFLGVYQKTDILPPLLLVLGILPTIIGMLFLFNTKKGKVFIDSINLKTLTHLHAIRIPVEVALFSLYQFGVMSIYITFEGTNFDIFSGITAPIVAYFAFRKTTHTKLLLVWNIICLLLLFNVVITAALAIPSPMQQLAFDQPNIAVLYFPFNLLPTFIVPVVLFSHLVALRQLLKKED